MRIDPSNKHILIVGAGPGGLTAAMILAYRGFRVSVFEARDRVGGRNAELRNGPYTFDTGPTFLMLKDILEQVFHEAGDYLDNRMTLKRLEPMYRLVFDDRTLDPTTDARKMRATIAQAFPGYEDRYDKFFTSEQKRFKRLFPCLQKSYHSPATLMSLDLVRALPSLALGRSLFEVMQGHFMDEKLALAFTFQSKYLGMSPWECPGLFAMLPYIEHGFGIYHPVGGLSRISEGMADVLKENGGELRLETPVERVRVKNGRTTGVLLADGEEVTGDAVVLNADFGHAMTNLFEPGVLRKYTPEKLRSMRLSCSTYMLYLGLDRQYDQPHHTIVFAKDYRENVSRIFEGRALTRDLSFYVRDCGRTDPALAPEGHSAIYVLVPTPNLRGAMHWEAQASEFREWVLDAITERTPMQDIREHIRAETVITPLDWRDTYRVYEGATFNLAHNLGQMIYGRPRNRFEELDACYLVGGGTHPGSGLPTIYESGRIAANLISRRFNIPFVSGNLDV